MALRTPKKWMLLLLLCLAVGAAGLGWWRTHSAMPFRIGFVGTISGRMADLGIGGRDGVILATEAINRSGGIHGRPVELLIRDDQHDPAIAAQVDEELIQAGAMALIGHMTSAMTLIGASLADQHQVLLFSPTASTTALSQRDDWFFRVYPDSSQETPVLAGEAFHGLSIRRIILVRDDLNRAYTQDYGDWFAREFRRLGGRIAADLHFTSSRDYNFTSLAKKIRATDADGLLLLANAVDTALLTQKLRQGAWDSPILVSEWSTTEELVALGGEAVEGLVFVLTYNLGQNTPRYHRFKQAFVQRFGYSPDFSAIKAYDAATILYQALKRNPDPRQLRSTIAEMGDFEGLQNTYHMTPQGDARQNLFKMEIRQGRFQVRE